MNFTIQLVILTFFMWCTLPSLAQPTQVELEMMRVSVTIEKEHQKIKKKLSAEQLDILKQRYPNFRIVKYCPGNFSGTAKNELVLGLWNPHELNENWTFRREPVVHLVGFILNKSNWEVHDVVNEINSGEDTRQLRFDEYAHYSRWDVEIKERFSGDLKCGIEGEFKKDSDLAFSDYKPLFSLKKVGLQNNKVVCLSESDVYSNWACAVYDPKAEVFRLWFYQEYAD